MNGYSQELRVFVVGCPSGNPIAQKLMAKINEAADKFEKLQTQRDALLAALKTLFNDCRNEPADKQRQEAMQVAFEAIEKEGGL